MRASVPNSGLQATRSSGGTPGPYRRQAPLGRLRYNAFMPLLVGCLALIFPRIALFLVWFAGGDYLSRAYEHWVVPLLGFFFLPLTTLVFAFVHNSLGPPGTVSTVEWLFVALAALVDAGLLHRGRGDTARWRRERA